MHHRVMELVVELAMAVMVELAVWVMVELAVLRSLPMCHIWYRERMPESEWPFDASILGKSHESQTK